ncbi:MAG: CDP-diacylglycerol--glycerol-3-phosphate 3-phosphatidyltransferase [Candidatus Aminicenantes bacterium]|nr:CDP-diacylglycerol--glycerol-3-phosphate 3-phosphatidyltransferase [Candidatus Aminicenantes bacterium]
MKNKKEHAIITAPNIISFFRLVLSPFFLYFILAGKTREAFLIFIIAISTDFFDGAVARIFNQKSNLGALLDPIGDKILMTVSYVALSIPSLNTPNVIPLWLTLAVIGRDIYIVLGALAAFKTLGRKNFPPTFSGKTSTVFQMAVPLVVLFFNLIQLETAYLYLLFVLTLVTTLISGIHYTYIGIKWIHQSKSRAQNTSLE